MGDEKKEPRTNFIYMYLYKHIYNNTYIKIAYNKIMELCGRKYSKELD